MTDELLDIFEQQIWLRQWVNEDLPIIIEILEDCMLRIEWWTQNPNRDSLKKYYDYFVWLNDNKKYIKVDQETLNKIKKQLIQAKVIPDDIEMEDLIKWKKSEAEQTKKQTWLVSQRVWDIIKK